MTDLAQFRDAPVEGAHVLWIAGELDASNAGALTDKVRLVGEARDGILVVDLSGVSYMDSSAIQAFIVLAREGAGLSLVAPPASIVRRSLEVLGIDRIVPVHASVHDAVRAEQ